MQNILTLLFIPLMIVAFYFLLIRPQRKRQQAQQKLLNELQPGSRVMTTTGIFGTLVSIGDKQAVVQIAPGVEMTVLRQAVSRAVTEADEDSPASVEGVEPDFEPYAEHDPSTLDLPSTEAESGIRDVTSTYRGAAANASADEPEPGSESETESDESPTDGQIPDALGRPDDDAPSFEAPTDAAGDSPEVPRKDA